MNIPSRTSLCGKILRLMIDGKPRTKSQIRRGIGVAADTEITARIRELRELQLIHIPECKPRPGLHGPVYEYRISWAHPSLRRHLKSEDKGRAAA